MTENQFANGPVSAFLVRILAMFWPAKLMSENNLNGSRSASSGYLPGAAAPRLER
jgi:hypothetical protein